MAETPTSSLVFTGNCPDCGERAVTLPPKLPTIPEDIDLETRDYDGFRLTMLEDLAERFPDRRRWTAGEIEVVLVEVLAAALDELSHDLDRVQREAYLETARSPATVRRLLSFIGYDAVARDPDAQAAIAALLAGVGGAAREEALAAGATDTEADKAAEDAAEAVSKEERYAVGRPALERAWLVHPERMERAREAGPRAVHTNRRMVTREDYGTRLGLHPLVRHAAAYEVWTGAWTAMNVVVIAEGGKVLDTLLKDLASAAELEALEEEIGAFHAEQGLGEVTFGETATIREVLRWQLQAERMIGREAVLRDAVYVPLSVSLSVRIDEDFFASEVRRAIDEVLGTDPGGFFEPGRLGFGEDVYASEIFQEVGAVDGVESVCLNRFKRLGSQFPDESGSGVIRLDGIEVAACENSGDPNRGVWKVTIHGGRPG